MNILEIFDKNSTQDGAALGQLDSSAITIKTKSAGNGAKWLIELDLSGITGSVALTYKPNGFTNAVAPSNNSIDVSANSLIWVQAVIVAGQITLTPTTLSAAINWRAVAYVD